MRDRLDGWLERTMRLILLAHLCACARGEAPTANCTDASAPAVTQPAIENSIAVTVQRLAIGCGGGRVSSGIPLAPGALKATGLSKVKLFVGGQEQHLYVEALKGVHPDGS